MENISIENMLQLDVGSKIAINSKFECIFEENFSSWKKDTNSPSLLSDAKVKAYSLADGSSYDGLVHVLDDSNLYNRYYASLLIKKENSQNWEHMHNVVKMEML